MTGVQTCALPISHNQWGYINHQWVHFGREFCRARNPRCADCIVGDLCPTRGRW